MAQEPLQASYARFAQGAAIPERRWPVAFRTLIASSDARLWMTVAFVTALLAAFAVVGTVGANPRGIDDALLLTGRISFVLFWPAYAGGGAVTLFGSTFDVLKRQGRNFGLAFASAHIVHLGLVAWLCYIGDAPPLASFVVFGVATAWVYLLAIASVRRLQKAIGQRLWRLIVFIGMNYIAFVFALDFMRFPINGGWKYVVGYLPFIVLAVGGIALRVGGWGIRVVRPLSVRRIQ